ncbi:hypothetical protein [Burkholderia cepacia]|uniref:hypothetical protein n=1 Tax=Burkholderia cepacia TaxID=292 RepID=UPI000B240AEE|nr:hypothetical protein [Burkholderia cepacia]
MSLADLIYKKRRGGIANANRANPANGEDRSGREVSNVSDISVSKVRQGADSAINRAEIPPDCVGALRDPDGGLYLPWGPCFSVDDVRRMRTELIGMVEELSALECWASSYRENVLTRVIRGPLADLLPNIAYFRERVEAARAEAAARAALDRRT